jgi:hypothetical protein
LEEKKKIAEKKKAESQNKTLNIEKELHKDEVELALKTAPKWIPDDVIVNCQGCSKKFTIYFRKVFHRVISSSSSSFLIVRYLMHSIIAVIVVPAFAQIARITRPCWSTSTRTLRNASA